MTNKKAAQGHRPSPWKESERRTVRDMVAQGFTYKEIAAHLPGRTDRGVGKQVLNMNRDAGKRSSALISHNADGTHTAISMLDKEDPGIGCDREYKIWKNQAIRGSALLLEAIQRVGVPA